MLFYAIQPLFQGVHMQVSKYGVCFNWKDFESESLMQYYWAISLSRLS